MFFSQKIINNIPFTVYSSFNGIIRIELFNINRTNSFTEISDDDEKNQNIFTQLEEYFLRKRKNFEVKLDLNGTEFQIKVWNKLLGIPYGETISYRDLANLVNNPKAVRAVGTANGQNPVPIIIPCHRVLRNNGNLGGYAFGIELKKELLNLERNFFSLAKETQIYLSDESENPVVIH